MRYFQYCCITGLLLASFSTYGHGTHPMTAAQFFSNAGKTISHDTQTAEHAVSNEAQQVGHTVTHDAQVVSSDTQHAEHTVAQKTQQTAQQAEQGAAKDGNTLKQQMNKQFAPYEHPQAPDNGHCLENGGCVANKSPNAAQQFPWNDFGEAFGQAIGNGADE